MELFIIYSMTEIRGCKDYTSSNQAKSFLKGSQIGKYVNSLDIDIQIDFYQKLGGLRIGNKDTSGTNFRKWEKDIYELTFGKRHRLFFLLCGSKAILLYACQKQKNKTEVVDADNIRKRAQNAKECLR